MLLDDVGRDSPNASAQARWNDFVRASDYPSAMQSWQWGELKAQTGWKPMIVAVERDGEIAAGAMILRRPLPYTGRSLLYAPRGPLLDWSDAELFSELVSEIRGVAGDRGGIAFKMDPRVPADRSEIVEMIRGEGFVFSGDDDPDLGGTQPRYVMKTDLRPEPDAILEQFHKKWRYNVGLAERRGVEVRAGTRVDLPRFYELLEGTAEHGDFRIRSYEYFERLHDVLGPDDLVRLFVAEFEGEIVAGVVVLQMGDEAVYVYGGSDPDYLKHMPNHRLHWEIMLWAREQGCTAYDFRGVSKEVDGEAVGELGGLNRFKAGFNAQYMEYIGEYDLVLSPFWYRLYSLAMKARG